MLRWATCWRTSARTAPTLCEGWQTRDLAAHLVLRERGLLASAGIVVKPLAGHTERVQAELAARPYGELVALLRSGPPPWMPMRLPSVDAAVNTIEFFVHHEDVRRAQPGWEPRDLPAAQQEDLWRRLKRTATLAFRNAPVGVRLVRPGGRSGPPARAGEPVATITGEPAELVLYSLGRRDHAMVSGDLALLPRLTKLTAGARTTAATHPRRRAARAGRAR